LTKIGKAFLEELDATWGELQMAVNKIVKNCHTIAGSNASYLTESLDILNPNNYSIQLSPVKVETLFLSEKNPKKVFLFNDLKLIKEAFLYHTKVGNRSIFISRKDLRGKKFDSRGINSKEVIERVFLENGFDIIYFEDLSLLEQVATSSGAKNIAGLIANKMGYLSCGCDEREALLNKYTKINIKYTIKL
jgi:capsular polysaccharide biosynthesis protein